MLKSYYLELIKYVKTTPFVTLTGTEKDWELTTVNKEGKVTHYQNSKGDEMLRGFGSWYWLILGGKEQREGFKQTHKDIWERRAKV
jgi:hypothetical protein